MNKYKVDQIKYCIPRDTFKMIQISDQNIILKQPNTVAIFNTFINIKIVFAQDFFEKHDDQLSNIQPVKFVIQQIYISNHNITSEKKLVLTKISSKLHFEVHKLIQSINKLI